jgi:hypothetical protein
VTSLVTRINAQARRMMASFVQNRFDFSLVGSTHLDSTTDRGKIPDKNSRHTMDAVTTSAPACSRTDLHHHQSKFFV